MASRWAPGSLPSGATPIASGVREKTRSASTHMVTATTSATQAVASGKPSTAMAATHRGEKMMPPALPPL